MQIQTQEDVPVFLQLFDHLFVMVHSWLHFPGRIDPASVEIYAGQVASRVAVDDAIWVEHRNDLENKVVPEYLGVQRWTSQIVENALHHPTCAGFTRMHSRRNTYALSVLDALRVALKSSNDQHITVVASDGLTQCFSSHAILPLGIILERVEISLQICVGVRITVRKIDCIFVMFEGALPGQSVVVARVFPLH